MDEIPNSLLNSLVESMPRHCNENLTTPLCYVSYLYNNFVRFAAADEQDEWRRALPFDNFDNVGGTCLLCGGDNVRQSRLHALYFATNRE